MKSVGALFFPPIKYEFETTIKMVFGFIYSTHPTLQYEVCQSNQHFDNMHKLLLLSCGVDISTSTAKENNVDGATNVNAAICLDIVKAFYHLNHIYKSINLK